MYLLEQKQSITVEAVSGLDENYPEKHIFHKAALKDT